MTLAKLFILVYLNFNQLQTLKTRNKTFEVVIGKMQEAIEIS